MLVRRDHRKHVVLRDDFVVLIRDLSVPTYFAVSAVATQGLLLAREANSQRVTMVQWRKESQIVNAIIRKYRTEVRVDKQSSSKRYDQVTVCDTPFKKWILCRFLFVHMRVEIVTGEVSEVIDIVERDFTRLALEGVAEFQLFERLAKWVYARVFLIGSANPEVSNHG